MSEFSSHSFLKDTGTFLVYSSEIIHCYSLKTNSYSCDSLRGTSLLMPTSQGSLLIWAAGSEMTQLSRYSEIMRGHANICEVIDLWLSFQKVISRLLSTLPAVGIGEWAGNIQPAGPCSRTLSAVKMPVWEDVEVICNTLHLWYWCLFSPY